MTRESQWGAWGCGDEACLSLVPFLCVEQLLESAITHIAALLMAVHL